MSNEKEESLNEFLARMSDSLETEEASPDVELTHIEKWILENEQLDHVTATIKQNLVDSFLRQYYYGKDLSLEIQKVEVPRMRAQFSTWRAIRESQYMRMPAERHHKIGLVTKSLEYKDIAVFCFRVSKEYESKMQTMLIGTDEARTASSNYRGYQLIHEIATHAQIVEDEIQGKA